MRTSVALLLLLLLLLLLIAEGTAQREGDVLQLQPCKDVPEEHFEQQHELLADGRNWTTIRPAGAHSLCVSVCSNCDPGGSGQYGRLQLQYCVHGSNAQAWTLVPSPGSKSSSFSVQTAKAFVRQPAAEPAAVQRPCGRP